MTSSDDRPGIAWWILGAATLVRLAVAAGTPLFEDEAYYWAWSRRLAAGYFDHPPLVAWVLRLGTGIAGDSPLGVRLGPVLCGLAAGIAMLRSAGRLDGASAARRAAWLAALIPLFTGTFVVATPDAPLLACAAWLLHATGRAIDTDEPRWWLAAGGLLGLSLLAKYTAVLIPAGVVLGCIGYRPLRAQLRRPGPWLAIAIALVVALPMIRWNAAHDWVSFRFQLGHGFGRPSGSVLQRELSYVGSQFALFSPVLLLLAARAGVRSAAYGARPWRGMLAAVSAFVFAFFALSALRRRPEGNWPALAYPAAAVL
ncbi:MAG: glycosyltransferase family 39 protein, partial [Gemmatimonadales bacterium]|nr:glycosyltransferase family 39 protein [Gemmatimonadales bacterium]